MSDANLDDIPGTYVMTPAHSRRGYRLNMFCMSLNVETNRSRFRKDEKAYLQQYNLQADQQEAVLNRRWLELLRLGGNIYYIFKLAIFDGLNMQDIGGQMSGITTQEFKQMMISGGRTIEGNRSRREQH